jgi:broad specificity phosphatase PhoE
MIYSSPFQRTRETAHLLAKILRTEEIEIRDKIQENSMRDGNTEHLKSVYSNFKTVVEEALSRAEGNCIIVSHRMPISLYVSRESDHSYQEIADNTKYNAVLKMGDCLKVLYNKKSFIKYEKF